MNTNERRILACLINDARTSSPDSRVACTFIAVNFAKELSWPETTSVPTYTKSEFLLKCGVTL